MTLGKILIVDDEDKLRHLLKRIITLEGYEVTEAADLKEAFRQLEEHDIDVVLSDVKLPDGSGVEFVSKLKQQYPAIEVLLLTAFGNIPDGVQSIKNGAFDYLVKGDDNNKLIPLLNRAMEKAAIKRRMSQAPSKSISPRFESIIGLSKKIKDAIALAEKVAVTNATVLLLGQTGTGKELFAQSIHYSSPRSAGPWLALNCSAFSKDLLENELFGHLQGAFTGALKDKKGLFEAADKGTLFLDEIGEMPLELQAKLLRVLESGEFIKVGSTKTTKTDVRIIAATNRNLEQEVHQGKFREDLYYRLNVFTIYMPSLNERRDDIPMLTDYYLHFFAEKLGKTIKGIEKDALKLLEMHDWKGNVRELKNILERASILSGNSMISSEDLPADFLNPSTASNYLSLDEIEKEHILKILRYMDGNKTKAAEILGIGIATLYRKMQEYKLTS